jgi:HEAT repeat protein
MTSIPQNSFPEIVKILRHPDPAVRRASADVIGGCARASQPFYKVIARSAIPSLIEDLKDENRDVRRSAAEALKKIDPETAAKAGVK